MDLVATFIKKILFGGFKGLRTTVSAETERKIHKEWMAIDTALKQRTPSQLRQALIAADKTLDNALRDTVEGINMFERLKNAKSKFSPAIYNKIWEAHKIRNNLVHESGYDPPYYVLTDAIESLRNALIGVGLRV